MLKDITIKSLASDTVYKRGRNYYRAGEVEDLTPLNEAQTRWSAVVMGTEPYEVEVRLDKSGNNVEGYSCDCPAAAQYLGACKHVVATLKNPAANIAAGTLQKVIDALLAKGYSVDYIHGADVTDKLGSEKGNIGLFLPAIDKGTFFDTIIKDGALPRKTFSMGEANEKRYYMEARAIR